MITPNLKLKLRLKNSRWPKVRGLKRRLNNIQKASESDLFQVNDSSEYNYYHTHLDWIGVGGCSDVARLSTMKSHTTLFKRYAQSLEGFHLDYQLFLTIDKNDAGCDAVYVHTPNPYSKFPIFFDDISWGVPELESILSDFLPGNSIIVGEDSQHYVVYDKNIGVPLNS